MKCGGAHSIPRIQLGRVFAVSFSPIETEGRENIKGSLYGDEGYPRQLIDTAIPFAFIYIL